MHLFDGNKGILKPKIGLVFRLTSYIVGGILLWSDIMQVELHGILL